MISRPVNPYSGALADFKKNFSNVPEWKWWHGQMRGWAWHWRNRKVAAAMLGKSVKEVSETYLSLAKNYRATFLQLRGGK
jgi:hypothetical protein